MVLGKGISFTEGQTAGILCRDVRNAISGAADLRRIPGACLWEDLIEECCTNQNDQHQPTSR